ncbi:MULTISPECIES: hypothetical protein [unclassified Wolbachia]|uniref:hypothetical protein n=1 Tax=unclassified Wolbachia TaxID=2640676 RepID=UPI0021F85767|nr:MULTISPECIES: hypothetical protein [unclassified Wolbachia]
MNTGSQCQGTGMTGEENAGMTGEGNTGMTADETTGTFIFESKLHSRWSVLDTGI